MISFGLVLIPYEPDEDFLTATSVLIYSIFKIWLLVCPL